MGIFDVAKRMDIKHNVSFRVIDPVRGVVVQEVEGHNAATNTMLTGIAHYLIGNGILNQGSAMLSDYVPKYISLGTMGLINQDEDANGYPAGIGNTFPDADDELIEALHAAEEALAAAKEAYDAQGCCVDCAQCQQCPTCSAAMQEVVDNYNAAKEAYDAAYQAVLSASEAERFQEYMLQCPGYGADGYDPNSNNNRPYDGLGPAFNNRPNPNATVNCELISDSHYRAPITYREVIPETKSELPHTIDVIFSAMVSVGALASFREPGRDYIFITEAGLWSKRAWKSGGDNGLLAGYRIAPTDSSYWDMTVPENRDRLRKSILRVGINQVVQIIWKVQLGGIEELAGISGLYPETQEVYWQFWDDSEQP